MSEKQSKQPALITLMAQFNKNPELMDLFSFNETYQCIQFLKPFRDIRKGQELRDSDVTELRWYLTQISEATVSRVDLEEVIVIQANKHKVNPIKAWLNGLKWDGVHRLDNWLSVYSGCENNAYTRAVGKMMLIASIARVFQPGIKYDYMVILEGIQGAGKSRFLHTLAGEWFVDMTFRENDKDIIDEMRGAWIIEVSELSGFSKKDVEWLKSFLSKCTDRCRLSYARRSQDFPRQSIFIGTTNPSGDNNYLKDDTGNRRFLPIKTGVINVEKLAIDREQIFAEAMNEYTFGNSNLYLTGEALLIANQEQDLRLLVDPWVDMVQESVRFMANPTMHSIMEKMGLSTSQRGTYEMVRIGKIMKRLGWHKKQLTSGERVYTKEIENGTEKEGNKGENSISSGDSEARGECDYPEEIFGESGELAEGA